MAADSSTPALAPATHRLSDDDWRRIEQYLEQSLAVNTRRAYNTAWRAFLRYCNRRHVRAFPADPLTLMDYVTWLAGVKKASHSSIQVAVAALTYIHDHVDTGAPVEDRRRKNPTRDPRFQQVFRGVRRTTRAPKAVKQPLTIDLIERLVGAITENTLADARLKALILVGFAGAFRRSELVGLDMRDLKFTSEGVVITVRTSKTDQEGEGMQKGIPMGRKPLTCPVRALKAWLHAAGIVAGAVFRPIDRHGNIRQQALSDQSVALIIKQAATAAGYDATEFAGHSLRAGLATAAAQAGVSERVIMAQTGHKSVMVARRYIRRGGLFQENAAADVGL